MPEAAGISESFAKYEKLIAAAIGNPPGFVAESENEGAVQVERGAVFATALAGGDWRPAGGRLSELRHGDLSKLSVVDCAGHRRGEYRPMLVYGWLRAFGIYYEKLPGEDYSRWDEALRAWAEVLEERLESLAISETENPAANGAIVAEAAWSALALHAAGTIFVRDTWRDLSAELFGRIVRGRQKSGTLLAASASDNPETHWYHELVILHALASYAAAAEDFAAAEAVRAASEYHLAETQPDHATNQPWALFAFIWNRQTQVVADGLLHSTGVMSGSLSRPSGVSLILLADALYCLRLFLR